METLIKDNAVVLFQGDSITDAGRSREYDSRLGEGYANMAAAWFSAVHPQKDVRFLNRGISGNRVADLQDRWQQDCIGLKPDVVSILIGVNDCWRAFDSNDPTSVEKYEAGYRDILTQTKEKLNATIVIIEPFVLPYPDDKLAWRADIDPKIQAARRLAVEFGAIYIPMDGIFASACCKLPAQEWASDGVHPTQRGHALITRHWLGAVGAL